MSRRPRLDFPGLPQHVIVRGNNRKPCFFGDDDRQAFLKYLSRALELHASKLHAWVIMTNHVHLLITGGAGSAVSRTIQSVGRSYVQYVNRTHRRTGTLFEGRFRSGLVQSERYFLTCMRYIELNPVRAGMVSHPSQYPWSSFKENAAGMPAGLLTPHPEYLRLGVDAPERGDAYLRLIGRGVSIEDLALIRENATRNTVLGTDEYRRAIEVTLGMGVTLGPARHRAKC